MPTSKTSSATLIDGTALSATIRSEVKSEVEEWTERHENPPHLAVVLVGDNPASASYVRGKARAAAEVGITSDTLRYDESVTEAELLSKIAQLNEDPGVHGILVQLPLPLHISPDVVLQAVSPVKDVDGFHPENAGKLLTDIPGMVPATPLGILEMLKRYDIPTKGMDAVVVGRSTIVGRPLAALLGGKRGNATVTVCHRATRDLARHTRAADILTVAAGHPNLITADMVKPGATVIDVGINRVPDESRERGYRLTGDVDFAAVREKAGFITPVPGGVGPMTIAMLLRNTLLAAKNQTSG